MTCLPMPDVSCRRDMSRMDGGDPNRHHDRDGEQKPARPRGMVREPRPRGLLRSHPASMTGFDSPCNRSEGKGTGQNLARVLTEATHPTGVVAAALLGSWRCAPRCGDDRDYRDRLQAVGTPGRARRRQCLRLSVLPRAPPGAYAVRVTVKLPEPDDDGAFRLTGVVDALIAGHDAAAEAGSCRLPVRPWPRIRWSRSHA